ncbi:MAG TPA: hypothetical protein VJ804_11640 [Acidimicrobiales bacterium]|nr:hypothetical protein [Acidimicrobiales bacterium]
MASGPYGAAAEASLVYLQIPSIIDEILPETDVEVARSTANAESDQDLDTDKAGAQRTGAAAQTTGGTSILGADVELQVTEASAPPSEANSDTLIPLDLAPLLDLPVINTSAIANWVSDTECVAADTPLSHADQALADLTLLEVGEGQTIAELDTDAGDGATDTEASTFLASIPGDNDPRAVQAHATTNVSSANVFNGLVPDVTSAIQVDVVQQPNYIASATGLPGGATITGDAPVVSVTIGGQDVINLDGDGTSTHEASLTEIALGDLLGLTDVGALTNLFNDLGIPLGPLTDALDDLVLQVLDTIVPVVKLSIPVVKETAADGTFARVEASILRVELLPPDLLPGGPLNPVNELVNQVLAALGADTSDPLVQLDLGPLAAEAVAPAGGITCGEPTNPLRETNKHASATEVAPGGTFEYNIAVPNRGPCVVRDVTVTDVVTGPAGFEIIDTEPDGTVNGGNITWDLGDIEVNETVNLTVTIRVPANAPDGATFDDAVTASGTCDGRPVSEDDRVDDIPVVRTDFTGGCNVQFSNKDASHIQVFPGETFSYFVHAFNSGGEPCTNVTITDTLDDRLTFVSCNKNCTHQGQQVTWKLSSLGGGSSAILSVVVQVDEDASGILENAAIITPENGSPTTVRTRGPVIGPDSIPKDPAPASRRPLPKTGLPVATGLALALGLGGYALYTLRRRSSVV